MLEGLHQVWSRNDYPAPIYFFIALNLFASSKVTKTLAVEVWIKAVDLNLFNNELLGKILGQISREEYHPFKRFTDLLSSHFLNVSPQHNQALFKVLDQMIGYMNDQPIKGTSKIVTTFVELNHLCKSEKISELATAKLKTWSATKSLKSKINKLLKTK